MKGKRIRCFIVACLCLFTLAFSGCGRFFKKSGETITVLHYRSEDADFYDWMVEKFEKEYNCTVQLDLVGTDGWGTLLEGKLRADAVDVFGVYPGSVYRDDATLPYMMDLSDMDFIKKLTDEYVDYATYTDGKQYCAPLNLVSNTVFYNKAIFNQYNLKEPTNYSEFIAVCETIKNYSEDFGHEGNKVNGNKLVAPILFGGRETWPITMTLNSIEAVVVRAVDPWFYVDVFKNKTKSFDDPLIEEMFAKYKEISSYYQMNSFGVSYSRVPGLFARGEYAMLIDGSWSYSQILSANPDIEIGVFPLPANDSSDYKNYTVAKPGSGFAIHKNTSHEDLAKKFIEFQYREDIYQKFLSEVKMGSVLKDIDNPSDDPIIDELYNSDYTNISPMAEYIISSMSYPHSICENLAIGGKDVAYAITQMESDRNKSMSQEAALLDRWMALYNKNYQEPQQ